MKKFISRFLKSKAPLQPELPDNIRIYCIGDIHGRDDLLNQLIDKIQQDIAGYQGQVTIIYIGDFIDRGMQSREVVETLLRREQPGIDYVYLRGNHEQTLLDFLSDASVGRGWLSYGGQATLASYNVLVAKIPTKQQEFVEIQQQLSARLPIEHRQFFNNTLFSYSIGSYFFVHAGIDPKYTLARQQPEAMLWIRDEFIHSKKMFEKIIVHGHTICEAAEFLPNRIGIDTGAYSSGILTCLVLENNQQRLLQTANDFL